MNNKEKPSVEFTIQEEFQELIKKRDEVLVKTGRMKDQNEKRVENTYAINLYHKYFHIHKTELPNAITTLYLRIALCYLNHKTMPFMQHLMRKEMFQR